jgi:hypothetical protein
MRGADTSCKFFCRLSDRRPDRAPSIARQRCAKKIASSKNVCSWPKAADLRVAQSRSASSGTSDLPLMLLAQPLVTRSGY